MTTQNVSWSPFQRFVMRCKNLIGSITPSETIADSKEKWNKLAQKNANYYVLSNSGEGITEEEFTEVGKHDYQTLVRDDEFFKGLEPLHTKRILEIGCGTGRMTEFLSGDFQDVYGVDIADEMVARATKRLTGKTNVHLQATDGMHLPFENGFFDAVFSFIVFQHMPDTGTVRKNMEEVARTLKDGGIAKIQLRGTPTAKGTWYYGPSFDEKAARTLIAGLPLTMEKTAGEGQKYFWIWLRKSAA